MPFTRKQNSFFRDLTFHVNRRNFGYNIPATDIDFLEYDNFQPIDLREFKNIKSKWRQGVRTASIKATFNLAKKADIPFYVVEHNDDFSIISLCLVKDIKGDIPIVDCQKMTLPQYVENLYKIRGRELPSGLEIPLSLIPVTRETIISRLLEEIDKQTRGNLIRILNITFK